MVSGIDTPRKNGLSIRHVLIVFTGAILCFTCSGMVFNTWSIFVVPISNDLGVATSQFTFNVSLIFLSCAIMASPMGNIMEKYDLRIPLSASVVLCAAGFLLCTQWTEVWQFYISGILEGMGVCAITYLAAPTLINRWYQTHMGLLVGICVAMMGVGGATWSMVGGFLISDLGWRTTYLIYGIVLLAIALPTILICVRNYPHEVGLEPYGTAEEAEEATPAHVESSEQTEAAEQTLSSTSHNVSSSNTPCAPENKGVLMWGVSAKKAFRHPAFYTLALTIALFNGTAQAGNLLPTYVYYLNDMGLMAISSGLAIIVASAVATCMQCSQAVAKIIMGTVADKTIVVALCIACGGGALGMVICWQGYLISDYMIYLGAILFGFFYGATNVLGPTITRKLFGSREYTKIYSRIAAIINITPAIGATGFAALAEISWDLEFSVVLIIIAIIFISAMATVALGKSIKQTLEPKPE